MMNDKKTIVFLSTGDCEAELINMELFLKIRKTIKSAETSILCIMYRELLPYKQEIVFNVLIRVDVNISSLTGHWSL